MPDQSDARPELWQMKPPPTPVDKLTIQLAIHHQAHMEQGITPIQISKSYVLETKEEPYSRRLEIGVEWQVIEFGHVENPGLIVIENRAGKNVMVHPTAAEAEQQKNMIVIVGVEYTKESMLIPVCKIRPNKPFMGEFDELPILVRSLSGKIPITVAVFPR